MYDLIFSSGIFLFSIFVSCDIRLGGYDNVDTDCIYTYLFLNDVTVNLHMHKSMKNESKPLPQLYII
jgi:hypothetical protein